MTREQARKAINAAPARYLDKAKKSGYICPCCGSGSGPNGTGITLDPKDAQKTHYKCHKCGEYGDTLHFLMKASGAAESDIFTRYNLTVDGGRSREGVPAGKEKPHTATIPQPKEECPQSFTIYRSNARGVLNDPKYPYRVDITDAASFTAAMCYDHVAAQYRDNHRGKDNFISSNCLMLDCDNADSDNPGDWITPERVKADFAGVPLFICGSKNNMKEKPGKEGQPPKAARPRFHVYFPLDPVDNAETYKAIQAQALRCFPYFDKGAANAAHPFQGVEMPQAEFIPGSKNILQHLRDTDPDRREYLQAVAANDVNAFIGSIKDAANTPAISTGFKRLDAALDGGLYEGLYIIGALTSLGKTTFVLQAADQIAAGGHDVIVYSLEMSKYELMSKSISRLTLQLCEGKTYLAKSARGITDGARIEHYNDEEMDLIKKALKEYQDKPGRRLRIVESIADTGTDTIRADVQKHIAFTGRRPVVIIDYVQILKPHNDLAQDKQAMDRNITELKRISRETKTAIVGVSSFNRENYNAPVNLASFKESGSIEYSSDVLLGLQYEGMDELRGTDGQKTKNAEKIKELKNADPRKAQLEILKNRNFKTGERVSYDYYPMFNYFEETDGLDDIPAQWR